MRLRTTSFLGIVIAMTIACVGMAQSPAPPSSLKVIDAPNDAGQSIKLSWSLSKDDIFGPSRPQGGAIDPQRLVAAYQIERWLDDAKGDAKVKPEVFQHWVAVSESSPGDYEWIDRSVHRGWTYKYRIRASDNQGDTSEWAKSGLVVPIMQLFNMAKAWFAIFMLLFCGLVALFINRAKQGKKMWVREIAGLVAIDEAVGRATEMGRPVLFVTGIQDINEIQTLAGLTVLSRVAKTAAEYGAQIEVPTCRSLVMAAARETVESAYLAAGRPDSYQPDRIHYLTDEQFAFVAGVTGYMVREEPAACIYMGGFYAESLILAETGNHIGAIQVAGTAMPSQLPFFVASCDYTLIGEEFFAASAYLSGDPLQIGSLKGQDWGKFASVLILVIGICFATFTSFSKWSSYSHFYDVISPVVAEFSGPTLEEIETIMVQGVVGEFRLNPQDVTLDFVLTDLPDMDEEAIAELITSRFEISPEGIETVGDLASAMFAMTQSLDWKLKNNPNIGFEIQSILVPKFATESQVSNILSNANTMDTCSQLVGSLNAILYEPGIGDNTLDYIANNVLGEAGLFMTTDESTELMGDGS